MDALKRLAHRHRGGVSGRKATLKTHPNTTGVGLDWDSVFFYALLAWGLPLGFFRSRFRKMVYRTESWTINVKPVFWRETRALLGFHDHTADELRLVRSYRLYVLVYLALLAGVLWF